MTCLLLFQLHHQKRLKESEQEGLEAHHLAIQQSVVMPGLHVRADEAHLEAANLERPVHNVCSPLA